MTALDILTLARDAGIVLEARGDILHVDAPAGRLTPELRDQLAKRKPDILAILAPTEFVTLKGGLVVPLPALRLALDLEHRGFRLALDEHQQFVIEPTSTLTEADRAAIRRWRLHLGAIVAYDADTHERIQ